MPRLPLPQILERLELTYGKPKRPQLTDPWLLILWENVAYLATDDRREEAFVAMKKRVGTKPEQILAASDETLVDIAGHGILAEQRAEKLRRCARIALEEFDGDLRQVLKWPMPRARRALQKFPGIGEPGADKILLFARAYPVLGLESNAVRVLLRLGWGEENKNYASMYRSVQAAAMEELTADCPELIRAHQLLRRHGQGLCKNNRPLCHQCPLAAACEFFQDQSS